MSIQSRANHYLKSDESAAATAVEYALIGGLLALGLVAALVETKGSLNQKFNTLSSSISAAQVTDSAPTAAYNAIWSTKIIASKVFTPSDRFSSGDRTDITFTDGSKVQIKESSRMNGASVSYTDALSNKNLTTRYTDIFTPAVGPAQNANVFYGTVFDGGTQAGFPETWINISLDPSGSASIMTRLFNNNVPYSTTSSTGANSDYQSVVDTATYLRTLK